MPIQEIVTLLGTFLADYQTFTSGQPVKIVIPAIKVGLPFGLGEAEIVLNDVVVQKAKV